MAFVRAGTIKDESDFRGPSVLARFDPEQKFCVAEPFAVLIQEQTVDSVAETEPHSGGDEHVLKTIGIQVADADPPGPEGLGADLVRDFLEAARPAVDVECIAEDIVRGALEVRIGILRRAPGFALSLFKRRTEV